MSFRDSMPEGTPARDVLIRIVELDSLEGVAPLFAAQLREHGGSVASDALLPVLRLVLERPSNGFILVATIHDTPVGVAYAASILSVEYGGLTGWLDELYVLPAWRSHGIGSRLLQSVLNAAEARGWKALDLEVDALHERAIALYRRFQFEPVSRTRLARRIAR